MNKTTLLKALSKEKEWSFFRKDIEETQSTIGIDVYEDTKQFSSVNKLEVVVWDFAGQLEYTTNHQVPLLTILDLINC